MVLENIICLEPCESNKTVECVRCKMANLLYYEMTESPILKCFFERNISVQMDNKGNSAIVGFYGDPHLLLAAVIQTDAYQIGCENFHEFQLEVESIHNDADEYLIHCQIVPIKLKEEKKSCSN